VLLGVLTTGFFYTFRRCIFNHLSRRSFLLHQQG